MIAVIAPFPSPDTVSEGWRSRIAAVDRLFEGERRVYVEIGDDRARTAPKPQHVSESVEVYRLDLALVAHYERLRSIVLGADMVYVHTIHFARYVLPFYKTGKVVTDIHAAAPEEELLYGRQASSRFYDEVEKVVLAESRYAIAVTHAMVDHFRRKHPRSRTEFIVLPVFEAMDPRSENDRKPRASSGRPSVIYSGSLQRWQNVDLMMDVARAGISSFDFTFLTNDRESLQRAARERRIDGRVRVQCATKAELPGFYREADYGLVLRDDLVVNRVSCPTKLSEYLWFGVIPVIKYAGLGDFSQLGYRYVTLEDFQARRLPNPTERRDMRRHNFEVIDTVRATFEDGATKVRELKDRLPKGSAEEVAFLSHLERNVLFPAQSELEIDVPGGTPAERRVLTEEFAGPYHAVTFDVEHVSRIDRLTWMPINRECRVVLKGVRITDVSGREIGYRMSGNYSQRTGASVTFHSRRPELHFELETGCRLRQFAAEFDIVLIGDEVMRGRAEPSQGLGSALHQKIRARLRSYPFIVMVYRRFVKPIAHGLRRAF